MILSSLPKDETVSSEGIVTIITISIFTRINPIPAGGWVV